MGIDKYKYFLNISCLLLVICFTILSSNPLIYAQVGLTPGSFNSSSSSFPTFGSTSFGFGTFQGSSFGAYTGFGMPSYGAGFGAPSFGASNFGMPNYGAPSFGASNFGMPNYGAPALGTSNFGMTNYGAPSFGTSNFGMPNYGAPALGASNFGMPTNYGAPAFGASNFGMPNYGAPAFGATSFGLNSYGAPAFGATSFGMPSYGAPAFGGSSFGMPNYGGGFGIPAFGAPSFGMSSFGAPMGFGAPIGGFGLARPMGFGAPIGGFGLPTGFGAFNPYGYQTIPGRSSSSNTHNEPDYESGFYAEDELPNIKGHWSGKWEAFKTDNDGVMTDPNGQIIIEEEGELAIYVKSQKSSGGKISGTIELIGWNIDEYPNWEGEEEKIELTGWLDEYNGWFNVHYFYFTGTELKSDYTNLISDFLWNFHNLEINASETGIFGQFVVRGKIKTSKGNEDYHLMGKFQLGKYVPDD